MENLFYISKSNVYPIFLFINLLTKHCLSNNISGFLLFAWKTCKRQFGPWERYRMSHFYRGPLYLCVQWPNRPKCDDSFEKNPVWQAIVSGLLGFVSCLEKIQLILILEQSFSDNWPIDNQCQGFFSIFSKDGWAVMVDGWGYAQFKFVESKEALRRQPTKTHIFSLIMNSIQYFMYKIKIFLTHRLLAFKYKF